MSHRVATLLLAAATTSCAQPGTPPGGEVDRFPPRVVDVSPAPFDTVTDPDAVVTIRFDERISERLEGVPEIVDAVLVSPATSPVQARRVKRGIQVSLVRGWEPNLVYRVLVEPVFRDLFGNRRLEPVELVFTTGAPIPESAMAGFVTDRLTGRAVQNARVEAVRRVDERVYVARTDTAGFFAMRYIPAGAYDVRGWLDQNRDLQVDFFEVQDSLDVAFGVRDTAVIELSLLPSDTTPARLARATPIDSSRVRLLFDDYFPVGPVGGEALLYALPDTALLGEGTLLHGSREDSLMAADAAAEQRRQAAVTAEDTVSGEAVAAADTVTGDTVTAAADQAARTVAGADGAAALPLQELIFLPPVALEPDSAYLVVVTGVTNIQGVEGGGGTASFTAPPAPAPDTVPRDAIPQDTVPGGRSEGSG